MSSLFKCKYCNSLNKHAWKGKCNSGFCPGPEIEGSYVSLTKDQIQDLINLVALKMAESTISTWTYNKLLKIRETLTRMKG